MRYEDVYIEVKKCIKNPQCDIRSVLQKINAHNEIIRNAVIEAVLDEFCDIRELEWAELD